MRSLQSSDAEEQNNKQRALLLSQALELRAGEEEEARQGNLKNRSIHANGLVSFNWQNPSNPSQISWIKKHKRNLYHTRRERETEGDGWRRRWTRQRGMATDESRGTATDETRGTASRRRTRRDETRWEESPSKRIAFRREIRFFPNQFWFEIDTLGFFVHWTARDHKAQTR